MSNLGDYVANLLLNTTAFEAGTGKAQAANVQLSGSFEHMLGQLERFESRINKVGQTNAQAMAIAGSKAGVNPADIQAAIGLLDQLEDRARAAADALNAPARTDARKNFIRDFVETSLARIDQRPKFMAHALNKDDTFISQHATNAELRRIIAERKQLEKDMEAHGVPLKPTYAGQTTQNALRDKLSFVQASEVEKRLGDQAEKERMKRASATKSVTNDMEKERIGILRELHRELESITRAEDELALAKLRQRGASQKEIEEAQRRVNKPIVDRMLAAGASPEQIAEAERVQTDLSKKKFDFQKKTDTSGKWAGVEGFRAIEDFAQGSAYGGLRGGLLAASNNIAQMGAAYGAMGAMAGSALSTVIILASNMYEMWRKSNSGADVAIANMKEYEKTMRTVIPHQQELLRLNLERQRWRDSKDRGGINVEGERGAVEGLRMQIKMSEDLIKNKQSELELMREGQGLPRNFGAAEIRQEMGVRERNRVQEWLDPRAWMFGVKESRREDRGQLGAIADEVGAEENINKHLEAQRDLREEHNRLVQAKINLQEHEVQLARQQSLQMARDQDEADRNFAKERSERVGGRGPLTEWEAMRERRQRANEQNAILSRDVDGGMNWRKSRSTELAIEQAGRESMWGGASLQAAIDGQANNRKIDRLAELGVITDLEKRQMKDAEMRSFEQKIREAKYGSLQADGKTGFQSQDVKSVGGMNALLQAIRYSKQSDELAELKKHGDIQQDIRDAVIAANELNRLAPNYVIHF